MKEMQTQTTMRYHFTPTKDSCNQKDNKYNEDVEKLELSTHCWWAWKTVHVLQKTVRKLHKKSNTELPYDPIIPVLGIYPREIKTYHMTQQSYFQEFILEK